MATRREIIEAILFLPAITALAGLIFVVFFGIIWLAGAVAKGSFHTLFDLGIPRPIAIAVSVIVTSLLVYRIFGYHRRATRKP